MCNVNDDEEIDYERFVNEVAAAKHNRAVTDPTDPAEGPA